MAQHDRLIGQALIDYMLQNKGQPEKELAKNAGYWRQKKDGSVVTNIKAMYQQFAKAQGVHIAGIKSVPDRRRGPKGNILKCQDKTGMVPLSQAWLRQIGVAPGARVQVEVLPEGDGQRPALLVVPFEADQEPQEVTAPVTAEPAPAPVETLAGSLSYV